MNKKVFKTILLVIIFGVPVIWYLFLQVFGENKFHLEVISNDFLKQECFVAGNNAFYFLKEPETTDQKNEFERLKQYANSNGITLKQISSDCYVSYDTSAIIFLVDIENKLRGSYSFDILEIDRAIVEADLLLTLQK